MAVKPVDESGRAYEHPLYDYLLRVPGLDVAVASVDQLLTWGATNSIWIFPMATSCCGIEFMAAAASRVDLDRMGAIMRATPRQCDVMIVAGTITVKMAPRVKRLWDQMPEPKWCMAMGSCAISGDFYRDVYSVIPGIDTAVPVDVYVPGCPPNPEQVMEGLLRLQEKVRLRRAGQPVPHEERPEVVERTLHPKIGQISRRLAFDPNDAISQAQLASAVALKVRDFPLPEGVTLAADAEAPKPPGAVKSLLPAKLAPHGEAKAAAAAPAPAPVEAKPVAAAPPAAPAEAKVAAPTPAAAPAETTPVAATPVAAPAEANAATSATATSAAASAHVVGPAPAPAEAERAPAAPPEVKS